MLATRFAEWVINHPLANIVFVVVTAIIIGWGSKNAELSANQRDFFKPSDENLQKLIQIENSYSSDHSVIILVEPDNGNIFSRDTLEVIQELSNFGWTVPYSQRVESITNHVYVQAHEDDIFTENLIDDIDSLSDNELQKRKEYATQKPGVVNYLINPAGNLSIVSIGLNMPKDATGTAAVEVVNFVREHVEILKEQYPDIRFRISGGVAVQVSLPEIVQDDMRTIFPYAVILVVVFLIFVVKDLVAISVSVITSFLAIAVGMGSVLWADVKITPILINTPAIIIILAMADCIHIVVNYAQGLAAGLDKKVALKKSIEINFSPVIFTSVTTAISFFALMFSESPPFTHMGIAAGIGILFAMVASLTFLPAMLYYLPSQVKGVAALPKAGRLLDLYQPHTNKIIIGMSTLGIALACLIPLNKLDDKFIEFFDPKLEVRQTADYLVEHISGSVVLNISIPAGSESGVYEPAYLSYLDELKAFLNQHPQTRFVESLTEVMKTLNQNMHGGEPEFYRLPESRELAAQYLLLYEMSLPYGKDLNNLVRYDRAASRIIAVYGVLSDKELLDLEDELNDWLAAHPYTDEPAVVGSGNLAFAHMQYHNVNSLSIGFIVALVSISLILIVLFRSWRLGLISMIPNIAPAAMAFGIWALINGRIGFGMSVGITLTLGIVVDDTIHFLSKYKYARDHLNMNNADCIRYALDTVGVAMLLTTALMAIAFLSLMFSDFTPNQDLALITIITIICAVLLDLILLPLILLKVYDDKTETHLTPAKSE